MSIVRKRRRSDLIDRPEELVYRTCYAPIRLEELLATAESRSHIRKLPPSQLYFGLKELDEDSMLRLLPHVTEEQWTGILDLDLWSKDRAGISRLLLWQRFISQAALPVARKLVRAVDPELWQLLFSRRLTIRARSGEDEFESAPGDESAPGNGRESMETPDGNFLLYLPENPEQARRLRQLILRLYEIDRDGTDLLINASRFRTVMELEEEAYQNRRRRIEDMGFQDYFDALEVYAYRDAHAALPEKRWVGPVEMSTLPQRLPGPGNGPLLLFQTFSAIQQPQLIQSLLEELFHVCNKLLSADRVSPAHPGRVKRTLKKAISGLNLGLDFWSGGHLAKAVGGLKRHYLQSFFQLGHGRLVDLKDNARRIRSAGTALPAGSFEEVFVQALLKRYPRLAEMNEGKIRYRYFQNRQDLETATRLLDKLA